MRRKNWGDARKRVHVVLRDICDDFRDRVCSGNDIVEIAMKKLKLPTDNHIAVYLMREGLRHFENAEMRRQFINPGSVEDERQASLFSPIIQDKYVVTRDNKWLQVPRMQLTEFERWDIINKLEKIGEKYIDHARKLRGETEALFKTA